MLQKKFLHNIIDNKLFTKGDHLLIAVSGGVDSVVLCELCSQANFNFSIAHVNFKLRGEESEGDEEFVRGLAAKYGVPVHVTFFDTAAYSAEKKVSVQVAARELRYDWFNQLAGEKGGYVLTAHHADDNIETVLMNFFRGTGVAGLRGMRSAAGKLIRPLLSFTKEEILSFAKENNLAWREDSSNSSEKYSRNYFRNMVIPVIAKVFPEAEKNLLENIRRFADVEILYHEAIALHKKKLLEHRGNAVYVPVLKLKKTEALPSVVYEIINEFGFSAHQVNEVIHLLEAEQGKMVASATHRIFRDRKWLIITSLKENDSDIILIEKNDARARFGGGELQLQELKLETGDVRGPDNVCVLDNKEVKFPLVLRKWKKGDYFYPLGLGKKKKVARFLIDQKLSPVEKENTWVLESAKRICWIVGRRIDDRFKVVSGTKEVLKIKLKA